MNSHGDGGTEFSDQVLAAIPLMASALPQMNRSGPLSEDDRKTLGQILENEYGAERAREELSTYNASGDFSAEARVKLAKTLGELRDAHAKADEVVQSSAFKRALCAVLTSATNDTLEIAKVATPILVGLVAAGTFAIPLSAFAYAGVAVAVSRMGVAAYCAEFRTKA
jgi:hypothetical protein